MNPRRVVGNPYEAADRAFAPLRRALDALGWRGHEVLQTGGWVFALTLPLDSSGMEALISDPRNFDTFGFTVENKFTGDAQFENVESHQSSNRARAFAAWLDKWLREHGYSPQSAAAPAVSEASSGKQAMLSRFGADPVAVRTFADAARITSADRDAAGVGSSEWYAAGRGRNGPAQITVGGRTVAFVSYNGRVWLPARPDAKPIEVPDYDAEIVGAAGSGARAVREAPTQTWVVTQTYPREPHERRRSPPLKLRIEAASEEEAIEKGKREKFPSGRPVFVYGSTWTAVPASGASVRESRSPDVWYEPEGGLLDEGWYITAPHGQRMGPFDSEETAKLQLRRARGW